MPIRLLFFTDAISASLSELSMVDSEVTISAPTRFAFPGLDFPFGFVLDFEAAAAGTRLALPRAEESSLLSRDMPLVLAVDRSVPLLSFAVNADRGLFTPLDEEASETRSLSGPVLPFEPIEGALDMADGPRDTAWRDRFAEDVRLTEVNEAPVCEFADLKEDSVLFEFVRVVVVGTVSVLRDETDVPFRGDFMGLLLGVISSSSSLLI